MGKIAFYIHTSVTQEVGQVLPKSAKSWVKNFEANEKNIFQNPTISWKDTSQYSVVILPGNWAKSKMVIPPDIALKCIQGTLRLVFWKAELSPEWSIPFTIIPHDFSTELTALILQHIYRAPAWGLQSLMPVGTKIFTERIRSEKQIEEKIEQAIEYMDLMNASPELPQDYVRTHLKNLMATALENKNLKMELRPPTFQMGLHPKFASCSVRWQGSPMDFKLWHRPEEKWHSLFFENQMSAVQMNGDSKETEIIVVLGARTSGPKKTNTPAIVDVVTSERLKIAPELTDETELFEFEYFEFNSEMEEQVG